MYTFKELQEIVNEAIAGEAFVKEPKDLYEPISYGLGSGGKRLRPVLSLMAFNLFSKDITSVVRALLGIEIFHNFTLVHDDIMDNADIRRNKPTVHKKWNSNVAILSGDAMFIKAYDYLFNYQGENMTEVLRVFNKTALQVCEGQQYDMNYENQDDVKESDYLQMIELKTAVLIAASLKIGALMASAPTEDANNLYQFGISMGLAFQLQDDYLDTFGDPAVFGKKIGGDIAANKKTYLFIKALEKASSMDRRKLLDLYQSDNSVEPNAKIDLVTSLFKRYDIHTHTQDKIQTYFNQAASALEKVNLPGEKKQPLIQLAEKLIHREM